MPSATARRGGGGGRGGGSSRSCIKTDPDHMYAATTTSEANGSSPPVNGISSTHVPVNQSFYHNGGFYHNGRSGAPTPSEQYSEPGPLLREVRARPNMSLGSPTVVEESFFHTSFQDLGKNLKACNDTLGELQQLGVSHEVQLPELVLVGDQSAGKSSLMSGLANLDLPRSEGTCTRCPLHISVSRNSEWSCRVWLRKDYSFQPPPGQIIKVDDVTDRDPFYPWRKLASTTVHEFKTVHDKSEIEDVLRWAQIAILNDDKHHALFIPGSGSMSVNTDVTKAAEETAAKFSPNIVALEIKGPDLPDLSFYDMPGIFQNPADSRDDYLVNVVQNLSKAYIQHSSAIIICSIPMNNDAENSSTFGLTRRLNASNRTIGVLTKADLLPVNGNRTQWLDIMNNKTHKTGLGYFITSRPTDKDLEELTKWEENTFSESSFEAWPGPFSDIENRCGVQKLKAFLSLRLGQEFLKSLPKIKQKVKQHLDKITKQLADLPELPENVELEVQTCLNSFSQSSRSEIDRFVGSLLKLPAGFRDCLLEMKPKFILKDKSDIPVIELNSDDESDAASVTTINNATPSSKRRNAALQATPSKRPRMDTPSSSFIKPEDQLVGNNGFPPQAPVRRPVLAEPFTQFSEVGRGFRTLRGVRDEIAAKMKAGMPDIIPPEVYNDLAMEAIKPWNDPMEVFLRQVMRLLHGRLQDALNMAFEKLKKRLIYKEAKIHLQTFLKHHEDDTMQALKDLYADETQSLLTFNEEALNRCIADEKMLLTRFRHHMRMQGGNIYNAKPNSLIPWESLTEEKQLQDTKRREMEVAKLGVDKFAREVGVVAYVRGYYRLAALRFADAVSQRIICRMIPAIRVQLQSCYLDTKLGVRGSNALRAYETLMEEDSATAAKRDNLKREHDKFVQALASIDNLEIGAPSGAPLADGTERSDSQPSVLTIQDGLDVDVNMENSMQMAEV